MQRVSLTPLAAPALDEGLRRHMIGIYRTMALGLLATAAVALGVASSPPLAALVFGTPLKWVAILAPLAFVAFFTLRIERMTAASARAAFFGFAALMGVSMAGLFLAFTGASIARAFLAAAAMFAGASLWGYTTRRDLSRWSTFLLMALIGVVATSLINLLVGSSLVQTIVSLAGVALFTALATWDTQRAKSEYLAHAGTALPEKLVVIGALGLYLSFVNLFQLLLGLSGEREA